MMKYNPEYIHFEHADGLIDKWCIASDSVLDIKDVLMRDDEFIKSKLKQIEGIQKISDFPFRIVNDNPDDDVEETCWKFVYIDPAFQDMIYDKKVLEWTDLKIGDIVRSKENKNLYMQVQGIDETEGTWEHIFFGGIWKSDDDLAEDWEKVED